MALIHGLASGLLMRAAIDVATRERNAQPAGSKIGGHVAPIGICPVEKCRYIVVTGIYADMATPCMGMSVSDSIGRFACWDQ